MARLNQIEKTSVYRDEEDICNPPSCETLSIEVWQEEGAPILFVCFYAHSCVCSLSLQYVGG